MEWVLRLETNLRLFVKIFFAMFMFIVTILSFADTQTSAHEIRPSIIDVSINRDGALDIHVRINLEAVIAEIGTGSTDAEQKKNSAEYDSFRKFVPVALEKEFREIENGVLRAMFLDVDDVILPLKLINIKVPPVGDIGVERTSLLSLTAMLPAGASNFTWSWAEEFGASVLRVNAAVSENPTEFIFAGIIKSGEISKTIPLTGLVSVSAFEVFSQYTVLGFEHIIPKGLDHILFVVGLFLLSTKLSSLLWQISSFTLAHTITLGLATGRIVSVPSSIIEPLIALSIVFVAVENLMTDNLHRWRPAVVFGFGLLHGLGFASVLNEIGLQPENFVSGLLGFNLGVEFGQLAVIFACFLLIGFWFSKKSYYRFYITNPASAAIAIVGVWWFVERVFL